MDKYSFTLNIKLKFRKYVLRPIMFVIYFKFQVNWSNNNDVRATGSKTNETDYRLTTRLTTTEYTTTDYTTTTIIRLKTI